MCFVSCREQKMRLLAYMLSLWSHFKVIMLLDQRLSFGEEQLIPMINWKMTLRVSITNEFCTSCPSYFYYVCLISWKSWLYMFFMLWIYTYFLLLFCIITLIKVWTFFIHSRMAGEKSKDGVSGPKKGSR